MKIIPILDTNYSLEIPKDYTPIPLKGRDKWITALRSGLFKKTTGELCSLSRTCTEDKYCCLGVLSKLQGRLTVVENRYRDGKDGESSLSLDARNPLYDKLGMLGYFKSIVVIKNNTIGTVTTSLASFNDSRDITFEHVAFVIEQLWSEEAE